LPGCLPPAVAATLLVEAPFVSVSGLPSALAARPRPLPPGGVRRLRARTGWDHSRERSHRMAALAGAAGALPSTRLGRGRHAPHLLLPEPAYWVAVGLLPAAVALVVLWAWYRPASRGRWEPARVPAVPQTVAHPPADGGRGGHPEPAA
jgi:hypothetical protein